MVRAPWRRDDDDDNFRAPSGPRLWESIQRARTTMDHGEIDELITRGVAQIDIVVASRIDLGPLYARRLAMSRDRDVALTAIMNPLLDARDIRRLFRWYPGRLFGRVVRREMATKADARPLSLRLSARSKHWDVRRQVAAHPHTPPRSLHRLANDDEWSVRAAVAANPSVPSRSFERLAHGHPAVRMTLATNPATPPHIVDELLLDPNAEVAGLAAGHEHASRAALERLLDRATTPPWVRARIANNPACPIERRDEILTWVALGGAGPGDPTFDPRTCLVNPEDSGRPIADYTAAMTPTTWSPLWPVRLSVVATAKSLQPALLREAARDTEPVIRRRAAEFSSYLALRELSDDRDALVRSAALRLRGSVRRPRPRPMRIVVGGLAVLIGWGIVSTIDGGPMLSSTSPPKSYSEAPADFTTKSTAPRLASSASFPGVADISIDAFGEWGFVRIEAATALTVMAIEGVPESNFPFLLADGGARSWRAPVADGTKVDVKIDGVVTTLAVSSPTDLRTDETAAGEAS